ncbi:hypothetical protein CWI37_0252p0010 [Hamiltosporidium tvaerminnensis]|uniref:Uncharacterized protein n=1 Tax=Hamiltosporidium tvaerminnensis TaxID=1176355 RepID=A0A4Q9LA60_9MICR|nr:hypothetical protein CWI37_0252p0010 [Hamiltosporidium tvaerminnensis]
MKEEKSFAEDQLTFFKKKMGNTCLGMWSDIPLVKLLKVLFMNECTLRITSLVFWIHILSFSSVRCAAVDIPEDIVGDKCNIFYFNIINEYSDVNISEFLTQSNPRFALRTEGGTFEEKKDICSGTHVDSEDDFCSNKIPRSDHIPIVVKEYVIEGKYDIEFSTIEMMSNMMCNPLSSEGFARSCYMNIVHGISAEQFDILEKFMLKDYDVTMLDITKADFCPMWYFIDMLQIKPSLGTDWFFVKFFKKSVLLSEIYKEYFLERNPEWLSFFSGVDLDAKDENGILLWDKILEVSPCPKTEEDCDFPDEANDNRSEEVRRYGGNQVVNIDANFGRMFGLLFAAIIRSFYMHLSYSVSNKEFVLENFTDQCYSENMMEDCFKIENGIKLRIVTDVIQKLHAFCSFRKYKHILAIFLGSRLYNSLEVTNVDFEPSKEYRSPAYKKERINDTFNFDGPEPPSTHNTLRKVFISDSFKRIKELKLNMVALGELDPNRLYDLRHLEKLEILNPNCKEVQRCVTKVLRCNIRLKSVKLFQIKISQWFLESISKITPEIIILKKCTLESEGGNNQIDTLRILPKDAKFIPVLKKFVLEGEKNYFFGLLEHISLYENLEFLSLINCFGGNITKDFIDKIALLKNLKVLRVTGNDLNMDINFEFLNNLVNLKEFRIANCDYSLSRLSILGDKQAIQNSLTRLAFRGLKLEDIQYFKCISRFEHLESLDLRDCSCNFSTPFNSEEIYLPPSLKSLNIDNIKFAPPTIINIFNGLDKLESVSMKGFEFSKSDSMVRFLNSLNSVINADFSDCCFEGVGVFFFKSMNSLTCLRLFGAKFSSDLNVWKCLNYLPAPYILRALCLGNVVFDSPIVYSTPGANMVNISSLVDTESFLSKASKLDTFSLHLVAFGENSLSKPILERFHKLKRLYVGYDVIFNQSEQLNILKKEIPARVLKIFKCSKTGADVSKDTTDEPIDDSDRGDRAEGL